MQNIENIMIDNTISSVLLDLQERQSVASRSQATSSSPNTISGIMNGIIKQKLKIVPKDVMWAYSTFTCKSQNLKPTEHWLIGLSLFFLTHNILSDTACAAGRKHHCRFSMHCPTISWSQLSTRHVNIYIAPLGLMNLKDLLLWWNLHCWQNQRNSSADWWAAGIWCECDSVQWTGK